MKKIRITNMVWTDRKAVSKALVRRNYIARFFDERQCRMCEYRNLRYSEEFCRPCPAYGGATKLYGIKEVNGTKYVGLPLGHSKKRLVEKAGIHPKVLRMPAIDSRVAPKQRYPVSFTGELFDYQVGPVKTWLEKRWGIVEAPPRTGKTVMCIYIACKLGLRTLILADQVDLLRQFMKDFDSFTDHKDASFAAGRPLVGIVKNDEDYLKYDIALSTYQRLNVNRKRLKKIVRRYGLVVIDEVHGASAQGFSEVANSFHSRYRLGVSATVDRKDGRHVIGEAIMGPVTARSKRESLRPELHVIDTKLKPPSQYQMWHRGMAWIAKDKKRNGVIIKEAVKRITAGEFVVIPVYQVNHANTLVEGINKAMGERVAEAFLGKSDREAILKRAISGKRTKCVVGIKSIIQKGINVPRWSTILMTVPMANPPKQYQELKRVCTPMEGKGKPKVVVILSGWNAEAGCLRASVATFYKYCDASEKTRNRVKAVLASRGRGRSGLDDEYKTARVRF